jgi:hypothetical protein
LASCVVVRVRSASCDLLRRHTWAVRWAVMAILLCLAPLLTAQTKKAKPSTMARPAELTPLQSYRLAVNERGSLAAAVVGNCGDSLTGLISRSSASAKRVFNLFSDSVVAKAADSLNAPRRMSLNNLRERVGLAAATSSDQQLRVVRTIAQRSCQVILTSTNTAAACADCREGDDYEARREVFTNWCDSTRDASNEVLTTRADEALDSISQAYENARDSVSEHAEELLDKENEEREARADSIAHEEEIASRVTISAAYDNPVTYRGRDNGVRYFGVSPTVQYNHRSGLFASVSGTWLDKAGRKWDGADASVGFEKAIGDDWFGSLAYTRLWWSSTSPQSKSVLDNTLDLEISWSGTHLSAAAELSYAFSKSSETTLFLSATAPLTIFEKSSRGSLVFEPGLTGVYGQQDASLQTARKQKSKKDNAQATSTKKKKVFAVLDYELKLPLSYRLGAYTFGASYTIIAPLNIVDESTSTPFGVLGFEVSVTIR